MSVRTLILFSSAVAFMVACDEPQPAKTQALNGQNPMPLPAGHPPSPGQAAAAPTAAVPGMPDNKPWSVVVQGSIDLDKKLVGQVPGQAVVFITGRPAGGGPPILVKKIPAARFPLAYTLTNRDLMTKGMAIPEKLAVHVRLDQDGDAISRTPGDLMGKSDVAAGATDAKIILSEVVRQFKPGQRIE